VILAALIYPLIAALVIFNIWAILKVVRSLTSSAQSLQKIERYLDQQRPPV